jgi:hypothetical protein
MYLFTTDIRLSGWKHKRFTSAWFDRQVFFILGCILMAGTMVFALTWVGLAAGVK